jgi:dihydrofolate synthase/folylpolyglutamate synthase
MDFQQSLRYLLSLGRELAAPTQTAPAKFDLENISVLAAALGSPESKYVSIHIAGTNGKGSTAAFVESILRTAGYCTGLYTSPHLERINERIRVNGEEISDVDFAAVFTRIQALIEKLLAEGKLRAHPTFFECVTAMAFAHFADSGVEIAVLETGLGGRLDATNIVTPVISLITRIDFDHENFLGHSLRQISGEKAGIIKAGVPVVIADQHPEARAVLLKKAADLDSAVAESSQGYVAESLAFDSGCVRAKVREAATGAQFSIEPKLAGRFQLQNALNAIAAVRLLPTDRFVIANRAIEKGIRAAVWPGRIEEVHANPDVYLDGAHNPSAARELASYLQEHLAGRQVILIFGALRDKAVDEIAGILFPNAAHVIFTEPSTSRAISAAQLAEIAGHYTASSEIITNAEQALDSAMARAGADAVIFVTGSLYLVGQLRGRFVAAAAQSQPS